MASSKTQAEHRAIVLDVLSRHIGRGNGISVREFAKNTGLCPRNIRLYISDLRDDGHAICGTPRDGYFIAETAEELNATCDFLHNRALHSLSLQAKLKKIPLPDLLGQLYLKT